MMFQTLLSAPITNVYACPPGWCIHMIRLPGTIAGHVERRDLTIADAVRKARSSRPRGSRLDGRGRRYPDPDGGRDAETRSPCARLRDARPPRHARRPIIPACTARAELRR